MVSSPCPTLLPPHGCGTSWQRDAPVCSQTPASTGPLSDCRWEGEGEHLQRRNTKYLQIPLFYVQIFNTQIFVQFLILSEPWPSYKKVIINLNHVYKLITSSSTPSQCLIIVSLSMACQSPKQFDLCCIKYVDISLTLEANVVTVQFSNFFNDTERSHVTVLLAWHANTIE